MKRKILQICSNLIGREILEDEQLIATGILDSFKIMELICSLEEEFNIIFLPEEIMKLDDVYSVNHLVDIVNKKMEGKHR